MLGSLRKSGIPPFGEIAWGTHFCHFFETADDLLDVVVPYFAAGLEQKELCFWLVAEPLNEDRARDALHRAVPDFDQIVANGAISFRSAPEWLLRSGRLEIGALNRAWMELLDQSQKRGFAGLRAAGCQSWLHQAQWEEFHHYERELEEAVSGKPMLVLCSYPLATTDAVGILDVADSHEFVLAKREGKWDIIETPALRLRQLAHRNRQQAAISALGLTAIRERDGNVLFNRAASLAAATLGTDRSIVWQRRPEQDDLILRARTGWDELPADTTIPLAEGTAARQGIYSDQPVVITDVRGDPRFNLSWILRDYRVATMISAVIRGHRQPWGALSVHSLTPRSFNQDDVDFLQSMANVLALAIERNAHEEAERRERERFRELAENIDEGFWMLSDDLERILYLNPAGQRLLGRSLQSLSAPRAWLQTVRPEDRERVWKALLGNPVSIKEDIGIVRPDGSTRWAQLHGTAIRDSSDGLLRICGILQDVTERKEAENERARLLADQTTARAVAESALLKLHAIESITDTALGRMALDELLAELLARLRNALGADYSAVLLLNEQRTAFAIRATDGVALSRVASLRVPLDSPLAGRVLKERRPLILHGLESSDAPGWRSMMDSVGVHPSSGLGAPLIVEGKPIGVVVVSSATNRQFTDDDLDLLRVVADRVAPAIERSRLMESVRAARERLESLSRRLLTVQEEERRRVAIELHDELGQVLTAVKIGLESMPAQLSESIGSVDRAMRTVRDLALELRPAMLDDLGLASALRWYADRFAQQTHVEMHIAIEEVAQLDAGLATTCFRVAQEALTNIARHASAKNVWLDLHRSPSALELAIRDDGTGFDVDAARERAARGDSLGLVGMEERVSLAGGSIDISSTPGQGTEVRARFPIEGAQ